MLQTVADIRAGGKLGLSGKDFVDKGVPAFGAGGLNGYVSVVEYDKTAVVLSSIGARCGKCFLAEGRWTSLANTQVIAPALDKVDPKFLWYQLNDESRWHRSGTGQPFIKPSDIKSHRIWLPPLGEQLRIAAILDHTDSVRTRRLQTITLLNLLDRSIFHELFGEFSEPRLRWPVVAFRDIISEGPQNGLYKPAKDYGAGTHIARIDSYQDGLPIDPARLKRVRVSDAEVELYALLEGDIVINRVNARTHLGKTTMVSGLPEAAIFESNMMRLRLDNRRAQSEYIIAAFGTPFLKNQIQAAAKDAVNQSSINQKDVTGFRIPLPPMDLQCQYIERRKCVQQLHRLGKRNTRDLDELFASLQSRAFRGEL